MDVRQSLVALAVCCVACSKPPPIKETMEGDLVVEARRVEAACGFQSGALLKVHSDGGLWIQPDDRVE